MGSRPDLTELIRTLKGSDVVTLFQVQLYSRKKDSSYKSWIYFNVKKCKLEFWSCRQWDDHIYSNDHDDFQRNSFKKLAASIRI